MTRLAILSLMLLLTWGTAHAQTVLSVPYDSARFTWDPPPTPLPPGVGPIGWYLLNCGGADIRIDAPATSIAVSAVLSGPGSYTCTLKAASAFGVSNPSNAVKFDTGYRPADVGNFRIEVR